MKNQNRFLLLLVGLLIGIIQSLSAQKGVEPKYESNIVPQLADSLKKRQVVCEFRKEIINLLIEDRKAFKETVSHERYYLNTSESLESFKEIKIRGNSDLMNLLKVRVIKKDGSIVNTDNSYIVNYKDEDSHGVKASVQGLEVGCSVEFINLKRDTELDFFRIDITSSVPTLSYTFRYAYLNRIKFANKIYNCNYKLKVEDVFDSTVCSLTATNIKEAPFEGNQIYRDLQAHLIFQYEDIARNKMALSWQSIANGFLSALETDNKDTKVIDKIVKKLIGTETSTELKARLIEDYIKNTIFVKAEAASATISQAIDNRYCNENDLIRLYSSMLTSAGIEVQYVFTRTRYQGRFDGDFPSPYTCTYTLIYVPEIDMYMIPEFTAFRMGIIPEHFSDQLGVFVKSIKVGDVTTAIVKLKKIPVQDMKLNINDFVAQVQIDPSTLKGTASFKSVSIGYDGMTRHNVFKEAKDDKDLKARIDNILNGDKINVKAKSVKIVNKDYKPTEPSLPFIEECEVVSDGMAEQAGNDIIVHLGWVIGNQQKLSKKEKRVTPVFCSTPAHGYTRKVTLKIPDGYMVKGIEKLDKDISYLNGKLVFKLKFTQTGSEVTFENSEFYDIIDMPADDYEKYEEVINAAAFLYNQDILLVKK